MPEHSVFSNLLITRLSVREQRLIDTRRINIEGKFEIEFLRVQLRRPYTHEFCVGRHKTRYITLSADLDLLSHDGRRGTDDFGNESTIYVSLPSYNYVTNSTLQCFPK